MTVINESNMTYALISTIDPLTVLLLAVFTLVFTILGLTRRGGIYAIIGGILGFITGVIYANGFIYYDPRTNMLVMYKSMPIGLLFITFGLTDIVIGIYKILLYPAYTR